MLVLIHDVPDAFGSLPVGLCKSEREFLAVIPTNSEAELYLEPASLLVHFYSTLQRIGLGKLDEFIDKVEKQNELSQFQKWEVAPVIKNWSLPQMSRTSRELFELPFLAT